MDDKNDTIPKKMTIREASEFWDTHSVADYSSSIVEMAYSSEAQVTFIPVAKNLSVLLEKRAQKAGISVETLVNLWIQENLLSA